MKGIVITGILLGAMIACTPVKETVKTSASVSQISEDTTEYELLIIDPYFDQWYLMNFSPAKDYSNEYYRGKNFIAVTNWNEYYRSGKYSNVIDSYINYEPAIDYGIEVNRTLHWYFRFVRSKYGIRLF